MRIRDWSSDVCSSDLSVRFKPGEKIQGNVHAMHRPCLFFSDGLVVRGNGGRTGHGRGGGLSRPPDTSGGPVVGGRFHRFARQIGRASRRNRVCQYVSISVVAVDLKKKETQHTI